MKKGYINGVFVFIALYFTIAFFGRIVLHKEIFPFFHWSLYSNIPQNKERLQLVLVSENNELVKEVNLLSKPEKLFTTPIEVNTVIESFYSCYKSNCKDFKKEETKLLSLMPNNSEIKVIRKERDRSVLIAIIKNKKISYVQ